MEKNVKEIYRMDNLKLKYIFQNIICFIFCIQLMQCQKMRDNQMAFQVEICSPSTKYRIEPVADKIKTLEGTRLENRYSWCRSK